MLSENKKQFLRWGHENVKHVFIPIMRQYAIRTPFPVVPVGGYPKSGTTWASRMVAHYLDLPLIMASTLAFGFRYVVHHHWSYHSALEHSIQVVRDGRDVMVSLYMNMMKGYVAIEKSMKRADNNSPGVVLRRMIGVYARRKKLFSRLFGANFNPWDVRNNLPAFIEYELQRPILPAVREPWPVYVQRWFKCKKTVTVKYEALLCGPQALEHALCKYLGEASQLDRVEETYQHFHFSRVTGRTPGQEDRYSFARKAIAGDWKNHFTHDACVIFDRYAGNLLLELEYETDNSWVQKSI